MPRRARAVARAYPSDAWRRATDGEDPALTWPAPDRPAGFRVLVPGPPQDDAGAPLRRWLARLAALLAALRRRKRAFR